MNTKIISYYFTSIFGLLMSILLTMFYFWKPDPVSPYFIIIGVLVSSFLYIKAGVEVNKE